MVLDLLVVAAAREVRWWRRARGYRPTRLDWVVRALLLAPYVALAADVYLRATGREPLPLHW